MRSVRSIFEQFWLITATVFVITIIGWHQYLAANAFGNLAANKHTLWDAIVLTIMLAPLRAPVVYGADVPLLLNIGRVLLPFIFVGGIFKVTLLRAATEQRVNQWFARTFRGHAVVCGLSEAGLALVYELLNNGRWVVLIDSNESPVLLTYLQQALMTMPRKKRDHFALIKGNATSMKVLKLAGAECAKEVFAVTNDDFINVDIATSVRALESLKSSNDLPSTIHVHFKNYAMRDPLKNGFKLFDSRALAGRLIVNQYPADVPWLAARDFSKVPHAMLIGLGGLGEQVLLQLAHTAHYACNQRMQITVVDMKASEIKEQFLKRYPMFGPCVTPADFGMPADAENWLRLPVVDLCFVQSPIDAFCDSEFSEACTRRGIPGAIYICLGNDIESDRVGKLLAISLERALVRRDSATVNQLPCTIVKAMRRLSKVEHAPGSNAVKSKHFLVAEVDVLQSAATSVITGDLEKKAKDAHEEYINYSKKHEITTADPTPWDSLDIEARQLNYNAADHQLVRLREMGISVTTQNLGHGTSDGLVRNAKDYLEEKHEAFAAAEHRRWAYDKLFFGWRYGSEKNNAAKLNASLISYEQLTEDQKQYDRDNVNRALHLIDMSKNGATT
jgi:voltage-gated potassium channel Kch